MLFIEENMPKLFTLGCSLTHPYGWKDVLSDKIGHNLVNSAMYASSNNLQVRRIHSYIVNDQIRKDDIIIWQITSQARYSFSVAMSKQWQKALSYTPYRPASKYSNMQYHIDAPVNYFDGASHVDVLSNHPLAEKASSYYDAPQSMEELLSTIILLNKNYKVLVFVGWAGALNDGFDTNDKFIGALINNNVPNLTESMMEWVIENDLSLDKDDPTGLHPSQETSELYGAVVIYQKLVDLGWV